MREQDPNRLTRQDVASYTGDRGRFMQEPPREGQPQERAEEGLTPETAADRLERLGRRTQEGEDELGGRERFYDALRRGDLDDLERIAREGRLRARTQITQPESARARHGELLTRAAQIAEGGTPEERARLIEEINHELDHFPVMETPHFQDLLDAASLFKETIERLINATIFKAYEDKSETNIYERSISFYEQSNLAYLLTKLGRDPRNRDLYLYYLTVESGAAIFHRMNATLFLAIEKFVEVAGEINPKHFDSMKQINGVSETMALYEEKYNEVKARYGTITSEGYDEIKAEVDRVFRLMVEQGQLTSEFANERRGENAQRLKPWEIDRALNVARAFFNITFRAAEQIASGQVPRKGFMAHKRYASPPQDGAVKIMNFPQWSPFRFDIARIRGGIDFLKQSKKNFFEFLRSEKGNKKKLGKNRLVRFGGMKTDELEAGYMFRTSGIYSSWRNEDMAFTPFKFTVNGETLSIQQWLERNTDDIDDAKERFKKSKNPEEILGIFGPLINNLDIGLGIVLKNPVVGDEVGYEVRKRIWEKVAKNNLPLMVNYLSSLLIGQVDEKGNFRLDKDGISIPEGAELYPASAGDRKDTIKPSTIRVQSPFAFENIVEADGRDRRRPWSEEEIKNFKDKLVLDHRLRVRLASLPSARLEDEERVRRRTQLEDSLRRVRFSEDEQRLIEKIKNAGRELAPQLADIVFPYVPFLNDIDFSLLDYTGPGSEFFKRRMGDLASYFKAQGAYTSLMNNPYGQPPEKVLELLDTMIKGIESPQGTTDAQEAVFPLFEAWGDGVMADPNLRQLFIKAVAESVRKPTSFAQRKAGPKAPSVNEFQMREIIDQAEAIGIVDPKLAEEMRRKKRLGILWLLWALFRDYWWVPFAVGTKEFVKTTYKAKVA